MSQHYLSLSQLTCYILHMLCRDIAHFLYLVVCVAIEEILL